MPADYLAITRECGVHAYDDLDLSAARKINNYFRRHDDSHLWPILGRFNVTERAMRRVRRQQQRGLYAICCAEYIDALDHEMSEIVNDSRNW